MWGHTRFNEPTIHQRIVSGVVKYNGIDPRYIVNVLSCPMTQAERAAIRKYVAIVVLSIPKDIQ